MVWTCKVFCRQQLEAAVISSSALVMAGVTGDKTGNTGSFYPFSCSSKQHAPESMISEITNSGETSSAHRQGLVVVLEATCWLVSLAAISSKAA